MEVASKDLVIGTRYWLDSCKDESGVFQGYNDNYSEFGLFNSLEGEEIGYITSLDGFARIPVGFGIYTLDNNS